MHFLLAHISLCCARAVELVPPETRFILLLHWCGVFYYGEEKWMKVGKAETCRWQIKCILIITFLRTNKFWRVARHLNALRAWTNLLKFKEPLTKVTGMFGTVIIQKKCAFNCKLYLPSSSKVTSICLDINTLTQGNYCNKKAPACMATQVSRNRENS